MDPGRWQRIEELYHSTLERDSAQRDAYLREACGGDDDLRREVESLLAQDVDASGFIDRPAWEGAEGLLATPAPAHRPSGSSPDPLIGRTVANYRIVEKLGAGGMGVVYRAEDATLQRSVALKFVSSDAMDSDEIRARMVREAQAAAAVDHPNICHVHGIHEVEGQIFIAMAYVDGPSLAERSKGGPLSLKEAVEIAMEVGSGLKEAHTKGIVHRDIKPQNIMLTARGQVKIMDFGLAQVAGRSKLTKSGSTMGTPAYMSPEQLLGDPVDHRTDIWALTCVLYELLTQQTPFEAEYQQAIAYGIVNSEPAPVTSLRSDLPSELDRIISKGLTKNPRDRYGQIDELIADLRAITEPHSNPSQRTQPISPPKLISRRATAYGLAGGALAALGVGGYSWLSSSRPTDSMAILPFEITGAAEQEGYLSEGLAEGVISNLARAAELRVLSRDIAFRYEGRSNDIRTIGADLGVAAVLKGRVNTQGDQRLISAELVDSADGSVIWSGQYRRPAENLLNLDREMALEIARRLDLTLANEAPFVPRDPSTENPEAFRLYLQGRFYWNRRDSSLAKSRDYFQQAVDLDPSYALAWAGLADAYLMLGGWSLLPPGESHPRAAVAARRAIALDPTLPEPHATLGYVQVIYERDWTSARREFEQSIELDPDYATAHHWFAFYHLTVGDAEEALAEMRKAYALDPLSPVINVELAYFLFFARRFEESETTAKRALELDSTLGYAYSELARGYAARGLEAEARESVERALELTGNAVFAWKFCAMVYAKLGDSGAARQMIAKIQAAAEKSYVSAQILAMPHAALGENDRAFELLEASIQERSFIASWMRDPLLDKFSQDPRFRRLMDQIGLQA